MLEDFHVTRLEAGVKGWMSFMMTFWLMSVPLSTSRGSVLATAYPSHTVLNDGKIVTSYANEYSQMYLAVVILCGKNALLIR